MKYKKNKNNFSKKLHYKYYSVIHIFIHFYNIQNQKNIKKIIKFHKLQPHGFLKKYK